MRLTIRQLSNSAVFLEVRKWSSVRQKHDTKNGTQKSQPPFPSFRSLALSSVEQATLQLYGTPKHSLYSSFPKLFFLKSSSSILVLSYTIGSPQEEDLEETEMTPPPPSPNDVVTMVECNECGHQVPEHNLAIHQAHACGGRARRPCTVHAEEGMRQRRRATPPSRSGTNTHTNQVINLVDDEEVQVVEQQPPPVINQWSCPRCTLLNPNTESSCGACQYHKTIPSGERAPDATRRQQLILPQQQQQHAPPSPGAFVGGGALLGGVLGAAGAAMRGESWVGGAFEGAVSGAVGGAVVASTTTARPQQQQQRNNTRMQPRSSFRIHRSTSGHHTTTTIYSPDGRISQQHVLAGGGDPMFAVLMANHVQNLQHGGMNIDNMTYEQLLERFGDGSENRGADPAVISSLPVSVVIRDVPEDDNHDYNKCSICLEQFQKGDKRKTLPCLHGFHNDCIDKWLRGNASCPICKHAVSS
jgi:hypothetical protein